MGSRLSNATCLTQVLFKRGEAVCNLWWSLTRRNTHKTNEAARQVVPPKPLGRIRRRRSTAQDITRKGGLYGWKLSSSSNFSILV